MGGWLSLQRFEVGPGPNALAVADVNADGVLEMIVVRSETDELAIYTRAGDQEYDVGGIYQLPLDPLAVVAADFNGDGVSDIAVPAGGEDVVSVMLSFP